MEETKLSLLRKEALLSSDESGAGWPVVEIARGRVVFLAPEGVLSGGEILQMEGGTARVRELSPGTYELRFPKELVAVDDELEKVVEKNRARHGRFRPRLGEILVSTGAVSAETLEKFLKEDYGPGPVGKRLVEEGVVSGVDVAHALAEQGGLEFLDLELRGVDLMLVRRLPFELMRSGGFVPVPGEGGRVVLAAGSPLSEATVAEAERALGAKIEVRIAPEEEVESALKRAFYVRPNLRASARMELTQGVRYRAYSEEWEPLGERPMDGATKNISETGLLFLGPPTDPEPSAGMNLGVHLYLPEEPSPVRAACTIVRTHVLPPRRRLWLYAVRVLHLPDEDAERLARFRLRAGSKRRYD